MNLNNNKNKAIFILILAIIVVVSIVVYMSKHKKTLQSQPPAQAFQFMGNVKDLQGQTLTVSGIYGNNFHPLSTSVRDVQVVVDANTKIEKNIWYMPTQEELKKTKGIWIPKNLKQETAPGVITDLHSADIQDKEVDIRSESDINNKNIFTATKITYIVQVYPESKSIVPGKGAIPKK